MTKAYESLGKTSLRVLLNRRTMAWATRLLAMEDACLPKTVTFSRMAKGRGPRGRSHFSWSDTVKASLAQAGLPAFETWSAHARNDTITEHTQWLITDDCWSVWCIVASLLSCHYEWWWQRWISHLEPGSISALHGHETPPITMTSLLSCRGNRVTSQLKMATVKETSKFNTFFKFLAQGEEGSNYWYTGCVQ